MEGWVEVDRRWGRPGYEPTTVACIASGFVSEIVCFANGRFVNGKDAMSVMSLRVRPGTEVRIVATGPDEAAAVQAVCEVLGPQRAAADVYRQTC
ncbi:HPr family phosphocarrier protein [Paraburkholderia sp. A1RI_3L]|nr:HPr family phosphocarrier protein [Paraburkholderia kururiensis]